MTLTKTFTTLLLITILALIGLTIFTTVADVSVSAQDLSDSACEGVQAIGGACVSKEESTTAIGGILANIVNVLLFLVGATSVIMLIIGGLRFIFSNGDPQQAASARNTILYSVVGVVVAVLAYAIINFVITAIDQGIPAATGTSSQESP